MVANRCCRTVQKWIRANLFKDKDESHGSNSKVVLLMIARLHSDEEYTGVF